MNVYSHNYLVRSTVAGWRVDLRQGNRLPHCDCGQPATVEVLIRQLMSSQEAMNNTLLLCPTCLAAFCETDSPLAIYPITVPVNERGIILVGEPHETSIDH